MVQQWEPGTQYNYDDVVIYEGVAYKIIQPHRSQGDWVPSSTPALWGRMQDQSCAGGGGHHGGHHGQQGQQGYGHGQQQPQQQEPQKEQYSYGQQQPQQQQPSQDEKQKNWYDLDDERKKQLEVGGGLALGAAALAGGFAAFNHKKKNDEEKKADAWAVGNWIQDAQQRAAVFHQRGPQGPTTWLLTKGKDIPQGAIEGGKEKNGTLYIARAYYEGGLHLGKAARHFAKGAVIGYGGKEIEVDTYEILLGDTSKVKWASVSSGEFSATSAIEGGREANGTPLYIAQAYYKDGTHPGKYSTELKKACIAYGGKEVLVDQFQVLVSAGY